MEKEQTTLKGRFHVALVRDDQIIQEVDSWNTVLNLGKAQVAALMLTDVGGTAFDYIAVGTGTAAPNVTQTALVGEKYRNACTGSQQQTTVANDTARLTCSIAMTATNTLSEAGALNSSSAGVLLARATFSGISVISGDTLNVGYDVAVA
ncbi:MAG: hypothetical protein IMZ51_04045 [Chloroflexi bacterium]|nr:hypothetical protein [Chloroflexota bacterium]